MVSIRLVALTAWLLAGWLMLNTWFVLAAPPRSEVPKDVRDAISGKAHIYVARIYGNQRLYFCVIWQHLREYFADENSPVLAFLDDLHLTPRTDREAVDLATIRRSLREWIPQYRQGDRCPDVNPYIDQTFRLSANFARFMNGNQREAQYGTLVDGLKQDYEQYRQARGARARQDLVGSSPNGGVGGMAFTRFSQLARARFLKTIVETFDTMVAVVQGAHAQVNATVAELLADPDLRFNAAQNRRRNRQRQQVGGGQPIADVNQNVPAAAVPQPQVPPRVPSPRLVVPQIVPHPRPAHIPSGIDLLVEAALGQHQQVPDVHQNVQVQQQANQVPPVVQLIGPGRQNQRGNRLGPQRRGHGHQGRRNGLRQRPRPQRPANPEGHRPQP